MTEKIKWSYGEVKVIENDTSPDPVWSYGEAMLYFEQWWESFRDLKTIIHAGNISLEDLETEIQAKAERLFDLKTEIQTWYENLFDLKTDIQIKAERLFDLETEIQAKAERLFDLKTEIQTWYENLFDLKTDINTLYPIREKFLLLRHDHVPARNEQNIQIGKAMQFRLYNPDPAFGIDLTTFKLRLDEGAWYRYGDSKLTFTEVNYRECLVYFNPPNFVYDSQVNVELYCEDHRNNPGIKLEIL